MFGARNPAFTKYFEDFGPTWDVWCQKPNIYELFLGFVVLETHFPRKCSKNIDFYTVWEPAWYTKADPADPPDPANPAEMVHSWQLAP